MATIHLPPGERFAWMEGVLLLAVLGQAWDLAYEGSRPVAYKASMTLRPKDGLPMRLRWRTTQSGRSRRAG